MYTELPVLSRCCFCAPLRYGLIAWAYLKLILEIIYFVSTLIWLSEFGIFLLLAGIYALLLMASAYLLAFFDIIFSFVLVVGIHKKNTTLLRLHYRYGIVFAVLFSILGLVIVGSVLSTIAEPLEDTNTWHFVLVFLTICFVFMVLHVYLLLLVRSELLRLKPSGQFKFVNHTADPECVMQSDIIENSTTVDKKEELRTKTLS